MKLEKGCISPKDFVFATFCFMQATVLRSGYIVGLTRQDSWAMAITGLLFSLPMIGIYAMLLNSHPGKNLFEIDDLVFGPVLGRFVSALYLFFFLSLAALNMRDLGNFTVGYMMPETPMSVIFLLFLIGCVYGLGKGIKNLMYLSPLISFITISALVVNFILLLSDVDFSFLKPFFQMEMGKYVQSTVSVAAVPIGEIVVFLMLTPMLKEGAKAGTPLLLGAALSALSMMLVLVRDIITLGPLSMIVSLPSFESVRYISLSGVLTRLESIYAVTLVLLFLFKISILLYVFALGLTQLLNQGSRLPANRQSNNQLIEPEQMPHKKRYPPFLRLSAALVFFYSLFVFESVMENRDWGATAAPFFSLTFELFLPAVTLLAVGLRRLARPKEVAA